MRATRTIVAGGALLFALCAQVFGCDADCLSCHPSLLKNGRYDSRHEILKECTKCHTKSKESDNHGVCGADCWSCHDIKRVGRTGIKEHESLQRCVSCHTKIDKHLLDISPGGGEYEAPPLADFLAKP